MWAYHNPVDIRFGAGQFKILPELLGGRSYVLVTYGEPFFHELSERLAAGAGKPLLVIDDVQPNPDIRTLSQQVARFRELPTSPEAIVAIGGGSVIDSAKVFAAARREFERVLHFLRTKEGAGSFSPTPLIAVPTTAGTGSEVTCWGTVWDSEREQKHSLALPGLYPQQAVIDPALMLRKPRFLTVSTGLDALSHALESLWNRNANPVSMTLAVGAARAVLDTLPRLVDDLDNVDLRTRMARAALLAGLAFSNTRTAIAHSLSYPITLRYGIAHGIACSFTLPMVVRGTSNINGLCREGLDAIFGPDPGAGAHMLERVLDRLDVDTRPMTYGIASDEWMARIDDAFDGERGQNFIGSRGDLLAAAGLAQEVADNMGAMQSID